MLCVTTVNPWSRATAAMLASKSLMSVPVNRRCAWIDP